jgi:hypothetical protein
MEHDPFLEAAAQFVDCDGVVTKALLVAEVYGVDGPTFVVRPSANLTDWDALGLAKGAEVVFTENTIEAMHLVLGDEEGDE